MNKTNKTRAEMMYRHRLLVTVSATALLGLAYGTAAKAGTDADRPLVWIELDGNLDRVSSPQEPYLPPFDAVGVQHGLLSVGRLQTPPRYSVGEGASISFQPEDSDWIFSASLKYGRSNSNKHRHQEAPPYFNSNYNQHISGPNGYVAQTADYSVKSGEKHAVVDFEAGKDVGLGFWGDNVSSQIALGIRFAQFTSSTKLNLRADPYPHRGDLKYFYPFHQSLLLNQYYQFYKARPLLERDFRGVGPSLSWKGSVPIAGSGGENAELTFDWGANAGVLFGRQRVKLQHHTTADREAYRILAPLTGNPKYTNDHYTNSARMARSHSVTVPNIGGLIGMSLKFPNAKVSIGYRGDFFLNAIDGGVDTAKKENRGFYGPYASISIGVGD